MLAFTGVILFVVTMTLILFIGVESKEQDSYVITYAIIGALIFTCFLGSMLCLQEHFNPSISPMDVYRNKTTLEITYRDSIAIDSTVVWKEEVK